MGKVETATSWMENTAKDNSHGYDQIYRWGEKGDFDCSAAVITAWDKAGVPVKKKGATYTGNLRKAFLAAGFKDVTTSVNKVTGSGIIRGDVLLAEGKHVAMYCGNGKEVEASINEKGTAKGGKPGDQTGKEFLIRSYRNYPWTHVLRYPETATSQAIAPKASIDDVAKAVIDGKYGTGTDRIKKLEAEGYDAAAVQKRVNEMLNISGNRTFTYSVLATSLNLRDKPGGNVIGWLKRDQKIQNDGTKQSFNGTTWYKVTADKKTGWVSGKYIKLV